MTNPPANPADTAGQPADIRAVRAIVFDAVGTTLAPEPAVTAAYAAAGEQFGSQLTLPEIRQRFDRAFDRQEQLDAATGQVTDEARERRRWEEIVAEVFGEIASRPLFDFLWDYFADPANWKVYDDVPPSWAALEQQGFTLCVASNFDARLTSVVRGLPPLDRCERVFISSLLGARKPGRAFFAAVEAKLQLEPRQILMVGDGRVNDYQAALAAGWPAVLLDRDRTGQDIGRDDTADQQAPPGSIVRSLAQLPELLRG